MSTIEKALDKLKSDKTESEDKDVDSIERVGRNAMPDPQSRPARVEQSSTEGKPAEPFGKPVVNIPFDELQTRGFLTPMIPRSAIAEEFRAIKRPVLKNIGGQSAAPIPHANLVMVTSALEGDGKTFTSLNLAISIAMEQDKSVLFVDADVLKASAGRVLGLPPATKGLIDILKHKDVRPEHVLLNTNMPKLRILPAGTPDEHATELLASESMHQLMLEMSNRYPDRVIVFDSPPLLMTNESSVLASFMGQVVFVAAADMTPEAAVKEALEHIGEDKAVGLVLNRASRRRMNIFGMGFSYSYGYGYGYGYGSSRPIPGGDEKVV